MQRESRPHPNLSPVPIVLVEMIGVCCGMVAVMADVVHDVARFFLFVFALCVDGAAERGTHYCTWSTVCDRA